MKEADLPISAKFVRTGGGDNGTWVVGSPIRANSSLERRTNFRIYYYLY